MILGGEEFVDATIHRIGEGGRRARKSARETGRLNVNELVKAAAKASRVSRDQFCSRARSEAVVLAKEAVIFIGRERGATNAELAEIMRLDASVVSRRYEAARKKMGGSGELRTLVRRIMREVRKR